MNFSFVKWKKKWRIKKLFLSVTKFQKREIKSAFFFFATLYYDFYSSSCSYIFTWFKNCSCCLIDIVMQNIEHDVRVILLISKCFIRNAMQLKIM